MFGVDAETALLELLTAARANKWATSMRCGIHVHMDVRDLSPNQLAGLVGYYCLFEPAIYRWVGDSREFNNFCLPFYRASGSLEQAASVLTTLYQPTGIENTVRTITGFHRYAGLNLKSIAERGSIEFRHLQTTTDLPRIVKWINIIFSLKAAAARVAASNRHAVLGDVWSQNPSDLVHSIMPAVAEELRSYADFEEGVRMIGYPTALDLLTKVDAAYYDPVVPPVYDSWEDAPPKDAATHEGYRAWMVRNFPKDEQPTKERPPPREITATEIENGHYEINLRALAAMDAILEERR